MLSYDTQYNYFFLFAVPGTIFNNFNERNVFVYNLRYLTLK